MSAPLDRRGLLCGIAALPLAAPPAAAAAAPDGALSEIGRACELACQFRDGMEDRDRTQSWDEALWAAALDRVDAVFRRAAAEPSRSLADLSAKARLVLPDVLDGMVQRPEQLDEVLLVAILRELAALIPAGAGDAPCA